MKTYIALFRGINVGGTHIIKMKTLITVFEAHGACHVRTYIQTGNMVFQYPETPVSVLATMLSEWMMACAGFRPEVVVFSPETFVAVMANNPFPEAVETPQQVHAYFLVAPTSKDTETWERLHQLAIPSERFELVGPCFYLHAPEGIGRSKLAAKVERVLGVPMTCRNWRTVMRIHALVLDMPA